MPFSMLWYDLETFGTHPRWDRIAQFAAVRTDDQFRQVEEPVVTYCKQAPDYVPHPDACLVTGITPEMANEQGVPEREFAAGIHRLMIEPATCTVGFNSIRFDDEFIRALLYRNFYDPYRREYEEGNSRWDIIDLLRMCHDLRPNGVQWVTGDDGKPSFKLEALTQANDIAHEDAHDALSDVRATIAMAQKVQSAQPRLFKYAFGLRSKGTVRQLLNLQRMDPLVHTSGMFTTERGCTTIVMPVGVSPASENVVICCDLRDDPSDWIDASAEELRRRVFTSAAELRDETRVPLKGVHINRSPALAPLSTLTPERAEALGIDLDLCLKHGEAIRSSRDLVQRVHAAYEMPRQRNDHDVDLQIYSGDFFPAEDKGEFERIREATPDQLRADPPTLHDQRGPEMLWRYIARNYPDSLTPDEAARWKSHCAARILTPEPDNVMDIGRMKRDVTNRLSRVDTPAHQKVILKRLLDYATHLESVVLSDR